MVIIVIIDNRFLVGVTRGCRQRVCHTTINFVVSGATYPILFYFCMFSKEYWYQSYWFKFFRPKKPNTMSDDNGKSLR